jgi:endonuclease G
VLSILLISNSLYSQQLPQKIDSNNQIIRHNGYILSYNETYEQANWVMYTITPNDLTGTAVTRKDYFKEDDLIKTGSATLDDYKYSGYDRGHLKPAGDEPCDETQMAETFYMSNVSPMVSSFNRGIWVKLENYVRGVVLQSDSVIVIVGGVLKGELKTIGVNKVAVPNHYYKVLFIYSDGKMETLCFILPNKKSYEPLDTFHIGLIELEEFIGVEF